MEEQNTYASSGVDYDLMDPFKRLAQSAALKTAGNIKRFGVAEVSESRGESVYLIETANSYLAHVEEGLGTKNLVADEVYRLTGESYYDHIAQDTVAMIVNDMITLGALPLSVAMHLAVGSSEWFRDTERSRDLIHGWEKACIRARCAWGGGETPTLKGVTHESTFVIGGSAIGVIKPKKRRITAKVEDGDVIILIESSGIHANGITFARTLADTLADGYQTKLPNGRTFGQTLLDPTHIYVGLVEDCLHRGVDIHYAANITGHGWRKLMRLPEPYTYVIDRLPKSLPIFEFLQEQGKVDEKEMYGNFNMGAGFALYIPERDVEKVFNVLQSYDFDGLYAGHVEKSNDKKVVITPKDIEFSGETLGVR